MRGEGVDELVVSHGKEFRDCLVFVFEIGRAHV